MCQTSTDGRSMRYSGVRTTVVAAQSSGAVIGYTIFFRHENAVCLTQCSCQLTPHSSEQAARRGTIDARETSGDTFGSCGKTTGE